MRIKQQTNIPYFKKRSINASTDEHSTRARRQHLPDEVTLRYYFKMHFHYEKSWQQAFQLYNVQFASEPMSQEHC